MPILVSPEPLISEPDSLTMPILGLFSTDDVVTPIGNAEVFAKHFPHARVEVLEGHHASMLNHPEAVSRILDEFLTDRLGGVAARD